MALDSLFDLRGRKALVTGAAMGIGRSCALALARAGADVAIVDRAKAAAEATAETIKSLGVDSVPLCVNVADAEQVEQMIRSVVQRWGRLDIAVNNAGVFRGGADLDCTQSEWNDVIGVNLTGTWLCACAEARQMTRQTPTEGKIINIGSIAAHRALSNGAYDASKAGVVHLTKTLAARWGAYNINVNSVSPGYVDTVFGQQRTAEERKLLCAQTPLGYVQRLEDLQGPILFFASRASDFVTGQDLVVDGGHTLSTWVIPLNRAVPPRVDAGEEGDTES